MLPPVLLRAGLRHRQEQWRGAPSWKGTQVTGAPAERTGKGPGKACSESPPRLTAHLCLGGGNTEHPSTPRPVSPPQEPLGVPHGPGDGWFRVGLSHRGRSVRRGLAPVPQCLFCPAPPGLTETGHCSRQDKDPRVGGRREGDVIPVLSREGGSPSLKRAEGSSQAKGPGSAAAFLRESSLSTRAHFWGEPARGPE